MNLSTSGVISGTPTAAGGPTSVVVRVTDSLNVSVTATLTITIVTAPVITTTTLPNGEVSAVYNQTLQRTGGVSPFTWLVATGALPSGLTLSTGGLISGTPSGAGTSSFTVSLTDSMGGITTQGLSITVAAAPQISTPLTLPEGEVSAAYNQTLQVTGGISPLTWTITLGSLPAGLNLSTAGVITGVPTTAGGPTSVTIKMTDALGAIASAVFNITIVAAPSITTGAFLPNAEISVTYTQTLSVSGGTLPYTWSLPSGSTLPSGLALSAAGVITGIPTGSGGPTSFTIRVTDKLGVQANLLFTLTVINAPSIMTTSPLTEGEIGVIYSKTLAYSGGTAPYSWSASGLPSGLTISSGGTISGIPTEAGSFIVYVTLTDSFSPSASVNKPFSIHIYNSLQIVTSSLAEVMQGKPYSQSLSGQGGNSAYTWSAGGLPAGLSISNAGVISGTPTESGNFIVTIGLADSISGTNFVFKTLTLKVYMPYDANGNGIIDMGDVVKIERIILGFDALTPASDADGSGVITMNDVVKLERVILGLDK